MNNSWKTLRICAGAQSVSGRDGGSDLIRRSINGRLVGTVTVTADSELRSARPADMLYFPRGFSRALASGIGRSV